LFWGLENSHNVDEYRGLLLDTASVQLLSTVVIIVGLLFAMFALMWQMNSQSSRLEAKIDAQSEEMRAQGRELEAKIDAQGRELRAEIIAQGQRVSDAELEQARLNGINSVLTQFAHTHEAQAGDD